MFVYAFNMLRNHFFPKPTSESILKKLHFSNLKMFFK